MNNAALINAQMANAPRGPATTTRAAQVPASAMTALSVDKRRILETTRGHAWIRRLPALDKMKGLLVGATRTVKGGSSVRIKARIFRRSQACLAALAGSKTRGIGFNARSRPRSSAHLIRSSVLWLRSAVRWIARLLRFSLCGSVRHDGFVCGGDRECYLYVSILVNNEGEHTF